MSLVEHQHVVEQLSSYPATKRSETAFPARQAATFVHAAARAAEA
jgi:hypothetical protein